MEYNIIADSCCDMPPELKKQFGLITIPMLMTLGEKTFTDDESLDLPQFMEEMKNCKERIGSACPSPAFFKEAFQKVRSSFAVTVSGNLSACFSSAMLGKKMAEEDGAEVHVFDSKSACAGETLVVLKICQMINEGIQRTKIISYIESFIKEMRTYFVLDHLDNVMKNGRLSKITGKIVSVLNIKPIMGSDGDGNIKLFSYARGQNQIIERLTKTIEDSGKNTTDESMVISHCNNPGLAEKLMRAIQERYNFKEILIVPTGGVSSLYADEGGIIMAF